MRLNTVITAATSYLNSYGSQDINQYSFRVGSKIVPPNRIKCALTQNNVAAFEELKKSFHLGGNSLGSLGIHNLTSYNIVRSGNSDASGTYVIGQDFERYNGRAGQIISGLDAPGSDLVFSGTWTDNTNTDANILADFYCHYDQLITIEDGQMIGKKKKKY